MNLQSRTCFPSHQVLIDRTGYSRRTIIRCLNELEAAGLIDIQHSTGRGKANIYHIFKPRKGATDDTFSQGRKRCQIMQEKVSNEVRKGATDDIPTSYITATEQLDSPPNSNEIDFSNLLFLDLSLKSWDIHKSKNRLKRFLQVIRQLESYQLPEALKLSLERYIERGSYSPYPISVLLEIFNEAKSELEAKDLKKKNAEERKRAEEKKYFFEKYEPEMKARMRILRGEWPQISLENITSVILEREKNFPMHYEWMPRLLGEDVWNQYTSQCAAKGIEVIFFTQKK